MSILPGSSKLEFIPWDFDSEEHVERARLQRVACGFRAAEVPEWSAKCRDGKMMIYWLTLSNTVPDRDAQLATHIARYPRESPPIHDTAAQSWQGRPRTPTGKAFHPIGHVGLISPAEEELEQLSLSGVARDDATVAYLAKLYVSYALQGHGYGGLAMRGAEAIARDELAADVCMLDTVGREYQMSPEVLQRFYLASNNPVPKIANEDWYLKLGYVIFHKNPKAYLLSYQTDGSEDWIPLVYFKKMLK